MSHDYNWENHFKLSEEMFQYLDKNNPMANTERVAAISRSIIHLAYYSCLHITEIKNIKYNRRNQETGHGAHDRNIRQISKYEISGIEIDYLRKIQADLLTLKGYRVEADYEADAKIDFYYTKKVFGKAHAVYHNLIKL